MIATVIAIDNKEVICIGVLDDTPVTLRIDITKFDFDISDIVEKNIEIIFTEDSFEIKKI